MRIKLLCSSLVAIVAVAAYACAVIAMPPFVLKVSLKDIKAAGSPHKAFLKALDSAGEKNFGSAAWRSTGFTGNVTYKTSILGMTGANMVHVSKPCGKTVEESGGTEDAVVQTPGGGGGGGGNDGGNRSGGGHRSGGGWGGWSPPINHCPRCTVRLG